MNLLAEREETLFIGQCIRYPGHIMFQTLEGVPESKKIEVPVFEDVQLGMSLGMAFMGYIPLCLFPRLDFLLLASSQLIYHVDKFVEMSSAQFIPHVIIRSMVGSITPLNPGPQHCQDHSEALKLLLPNTRVVKLTSPEQVVPAYREALAVPGPWLLIEAPPKRQGYET